MGISIVGIPILGGLHHRYAFAATARAHPRRTSVQRSRRMEFLRPTGIHTLLAAEKGQGVRAFAALAPGAMSWQW
jgi:hypothetical protein